MEQYKYPLCALYVFKQGYPQRDFRDDCAEFV